VTFEPIRPSSTAQQGQPAHPIVANPETPTTVGGFIGQLARGLDQGTQQLGQQVNAIAFPNPLGMLGQAADYTDRIRQMWDTANGHPHSSAPATAPRAAPTAMDRLIPVAHNAAAADVAAMGNAVLAAGQHVITGHRPTHPMAPEASGPSTQETVGSQPWLSDQPHNAAERLARLVGTSVPYAVTGPGGAGVKAGTAVVPATASWGASELAPDDWKQEAALGGALAGGLGIGAADHVLGSAPINALNAAAHNAGPEGIQQGLALFDRAPIKLTRAEAIAQATGGKSALPQLQHFWENSQHSASDAASFFADRGNQVRDYGQDVLNQISPRTPAPGALAAQGQSAANDVLTQAAQVRRRITDPLYTHADAQNVDPAALADILQGVQGQAAADKTGLLGGRLGQFHDQFYDPQGGLITDIGNLSRIRNYWNEQTDLPPMGADALTKEQSGAIGSHLANVEALLRTNPHYAMAQKLYGDVSGALNNPLEQGAIGSLSGDGRPSLGDQTNTLFPRSPLPGDPEQSALALALLEGQKQGVGADMTKTFLGQRLDQALRSPNGAATPDGDGGYTGLNQYGGARFARDVAGTPLRADNLNGAINVVAPNAAPALADALDAFSATGWRIPTGSRTAFNQELQGAAHIAPTRMITGLLDPLEWANRIDKMTGGAAYRNQLDQIGQFMTSEDPNQALIDALSEGAARRAAAMRMITSQTVTPQLQDQSQ